MTTPEREPLERPLWRVVLAQAPRYPQAPLELHVKGRKQAQARDWSLSHNRLVRPCCASRTVKPQEEKDERQAGRGCRPGGSQGQTPPS